MAISMPVVIGIPDADGHRDQERDHAGRFRGRAMAQGVSRFEAIVDAGASGRGRSS
jgi:hypothetical protein